MRFGLALVALTTVFSSAAALSNGDHAVRSDEHELYRRRGGGGRGGRGGSSGGGSSGGGGGRSGSSGGGSTPSPSFGGGRYYGGGASRPYQAGSRSPGAGIAPFFLVGGALAFWPGYHMWGHGAHMYEYDDEYEFFNETSNREESLPVICGCSENAQCSCDENTDDDYLDDLIGNGDYNELDTSVVNVGERNGEKVLLINGTVEGDADESFATGSKRLMMESLGYWPAAAAVVAAVFLA